jgi:ABC-type multidrug transport system fused ATPase/permease subunit
MREGETKNIYLMRIGGKLDKEAGVTWETSDVTAEAGVKYVGGSGTITFAPGQDHAEIEVVILDNDSWETTKEFKVTLTRGTGCALGAYLYETRITIIDDDAFPSNKYKEDLLEGEEGIERVPKSVLMWGFLKHCVHEIPGIKRKCILIVLMDQLHNVYYLLKTYLISIYLVDVVFATEPEGTLWAGTRDKTAILVAVLLAVPLAILHWWDSKKVELNISGDLCSYFQTCLFTRYFNYTAKARRRTPVAEIQYAINKEAAELVECGFLKCFEVINMVGKLIIFFAFVLHENPTSVWVLILYPVCVGVWLFLRVDKLIEAAEEVVNGENTVADRVQTACQQYHLISDYGRRPMMAKELRHKIELMNDSVKEKEAVSVTSEKFTSWMSTGLISIYIIIYSRAVLQHKLPLGTFLAMVKLFGELGESFEKAFSLLMDFFSATGPLQKVTRFLNSQVDLEDSLKRTRTEIEESLKVRKIIQEKHPHLSAQERVDSMRIEIAPDMRFNYAQFEGVAKEDSNWVLCAESEIKVEQGKLISIFGAHSTGKATMVRILSGALFPTSGHICVPSHLRRLHVAHEPMLLETGLWGNLCYGIERDLLKMLQHQASNPRQSYANSFNAATLGKMIIKLLSRFEGPFGDLLTRFEAELADERLREDLESAATWRDTLTGAHVALISILRGVVMNPELMVIDRPLVHFGGNTQTALLQVLKEHVAQKGWMSTHAMELRRPRTVVFSTDYGWAAGRADIRLDLNRSTDHHTGQDYCVVSKRT